MMHHVDDELNNIQNVDERYWGDDKDLSSDSCLDTINNTSIWDVESLEPIYEIKGFEDNQHHTSGSNAKSLRGSIWNLWGLLDNDPIYDSYQVYGDYPCGGDHRVALYDTYTPSLNSKERFILDKNGIVRCTDYSGKLMCIHQPKNTRRYQLQGEMDRDDFIIDIGDNVEYSISDSLSPHRGENTVFGLIFNVISTTIN